MKKPVKNISDHMNKKFLTICEGVAVLNLIVGLYLWSEGLFASIYLIILALVLGLCIPNVYIEKMNKD